MTEEKSGKYSARASDGVNEIEFPAQVTHLKFLSLASSVPQPVEFNSFYLTCQFSGYEGVVPGITWFKDGAIVS